MIRPTELLRSSSFEQHSGFSAPSDLKPQPAQCACACLQGATRPGWFLLVLSALGLFHGVAVGYLATTAKAISQTQSFPFWLINLLLLTSELVQGVLGIAGAQLGRRGRRPLWIAAAIFVQATTCFIAFLPTATHHHNSFDFYLDPRVTGLSCSSLSHPIATPPLVTIVLLFVVQFGAGIGNIALLCHGLAYLDDNLDHHESPLFIGVAMSTRVVGPEIGSLLATYFLSYRLWWLGWPIISLGLILLAVALAMFPLRMPNTAVKRMAKEILMMANETIMGNSKRAVHFGMRPTTAVEDYGVFSSLIRLLTNRVVLFNILSTVFAQLAYSNFSSREDLYIQSRYHVARTRYSPYYGWLYLNWTDIVKPLLTSLAIVTSGVIIAKCRPRVRFLALWNFLVLLLVVGGYIGSIFIHCKLPPIAGDFYDSYNMIRECNANCQCPSSSFTPVCVHPRIQPFDFRPPGSSIHANSSFTFFTPCLAGCWDDHSSCNCVRSGTFTWGACAQTTCQASWTTYQCVALAMAVLIASTVVGNLLVSYRSIDVSDKSLVVGLQLSLVGLISFVPGQILYSYILDNTCNRWIGNNKHNDCLMHNPQTLSLNLNLLTAVVMFVAALLAALVWFFVRNLELYKEQDELSTGGDADDENDEEDDESDKKPSKIKQKLRARRLTPAAKRRSKGSPVASTVIAVENNNTHPTETEMIPLQQRAPGGGEDTDASNEMSDEVFDGDVDHENVVVRNRPARVRGFSYAQPAELENIHLKKSIRV